MQILGHLLEGKLLVELKSEIKIFDVLLLFVFESFNVLKKILKLNFVFEMCDIRVVLVAQVQWVHPAYRELKANQGHLVDFSAVHQDRKVMLEHPANLELQEPTVVTDNQDPQVHLVPSVLHRFIIKLLILSLVLQDLLGHRDHRDLQVVRLDQV